MIVRTLSAFSDLRVCVFVIIYVCVCAWCKETASARVAVKKRRGA